MSKSLSHRRRTLVVEPAARLGILWSPGNRAIDKVASPTYLDARIPRRRSPDYLVIPVTRLGLRRLSLLPSAGYLVVGGLLSVLARRRVAGTARVADPSVGFRLMRLEELTPGAEIAGVVEGQTVKVVATTPHGSTAMTLVYRTGDGTVGERLLSRNDEASLRGVARSRAFAFDADPELFRLAAEARRIQLAHLFDPYLAVHTSDVQLLPHQLIAVFGTMLERQPLRFLLADDPGAGKTIMAGLLIKQLIYRGDVQRCLVLAPGSLSEQWQDEMREKFGLRFDILTRDMIEASHGGNPFEGRDLVIARMHHVAWREDLMTHLRSSEWDLVIIDEAHRCSAHLYGDEIKGTQLRTMAEAAGDVSRHLLLMTATPHAGIEEDFELFLSLLDSDRFAGKGRGRSGFGYDDIMLRRVKEDLRRFDGTKLFKPRRAVAAKYELSALEQHLYDRVTEYVQDQMGLAERLRDVGQGRRGNRVGFALTTLQRRLASSPEAILRSLTRRKERLEQGVKEAELGIRAIQELQADERDVDLDEVDDLPDEEVEELEDEVVDQASAAQTIEEMRKEIVILGDLQALAERVRRAETDKKWEQLRDLLDDPAMREPGGGRRKLIIFSEHRDTLTYLTDRISRLFGPEEIVTIHGGMNRELRRVAQARFVQDPTVTILIATDAAGEGVNLQRANLLINYDLPWNPNRIEQRFGRIHRIGQEEVCHMWNLVADGTREGQVYLRLLEKLERIGEAMGGKVFDVLGLAFEGTPLRKLLIDAIRYGKDPKVLEELQDKVDEVLSDDALDTIQRNDLGTTSLGTGDVEEERLKLERAKAMRLQPDYIADFFEGAGSRCGLSLKPREKGRYELRHVPAELRSRGNASGVGAPVTDRYQRITFELERVKEAPQAELIAPGHRLFDALVSLTMERHGSLLRSGAVLISDADPGEEARVLLWLEHAIHDGRVTSAGPRVISKTTLFVEVTESAERNAGPAAFLDYRSPDEDELLLIKPLLDAGWIGPRVEDRARDYAIEHIVPGHVAEVQDRTISRVDRTLAAVKERLTREIVYWDNKARQLAEEVAAGKKQELNVGRAESRRDDLTHRLRRRQHELALERQVSPQPPTITAAALVVPRGLIERLRGLRPAGVTVYEADKMATMRAAVDAVFEVERRLGRVPKEMAINNPGYDIESIDPKTGDLYFIEVKGRLAGGDTVCITKRELRTSRNKTDRFILALVRVEDDGRTEVRYLPGAIEGSEQVHFAMASVTYDWDLMFESARAVADGS